MRISTVCAGLARRHEAMGLAAAVALMASTAVAAPPPSTGNPESGVHQHAASTPDYMQPNESSWVLPAHAYSDNRQLDQQQITPANVGQMKAAWTFTIPDNTPIEAAPIVWDGTIYITSGHDDVYAINAKSGQLEWQYKDNPTQIVGFPRNRGVALLDGNVYIATEDGHIVALNAKTGTKVWDKLEVQDKKDSFYTMQPVPYKGLLILGVSDGDWGGIGNVSAFDAKTGARVWQWDTVPKPGDPANKTWAGDSWKRGGATVWSGVAIDTKTGTLYADLGNPQPDFYIANRKGTNLYSDSMVALDITGTKPKLKWYHQFIPHDTHDWDPAMPPVLFEGKVDGKSRRLVAAGDKAGNFWILDAENGHLVHHLPVSYQYGQGDNPSRNGDYACPNTNGGVEYNGGSYDPHSNTFFVPSINQCGRWTADAKPNYVAGQFYLGGKFPTVVGPNWGWFNAIDVSTGMMAWRHYFNLPANGGALVLSSGAGSVVFTGELSGEFDAFDGKTGKVLWHHDTGASVTAPPSTFVMDGQRYVVVASGDPGFLKVPEMAEQKIGPAVLTAFVSQGSNVAQTPGGGATGTNTATPPATK